MPESPSPAVADSKARSLYVTECPALSGYPDLLLGLGTRHIAAASISQQTDALAVVVSESSIVRLFNHGELTAEILPEMWLMSRFSSHVVHPKKTDYPHEHVTVFASEDDDAASN